MALRAPFRRSDERWLGGVAAGLAHRLGIDPALIRSIFLLLTIAGGLGFILYGLVWLLLPDADGEILVAELVRGRPQSALVGAVIMVVVGSFRPILWAWPSHYYSDFWYLLYLSALWALLVAFVIILATLVLARRAAKRRVKLAVEHGRADLAHTVPTHGAPLVQSSPTADAVPLPPADAVPIGEQEPGTESLLASFGTRDELPGFPGVDGRPLAGAATAPIWFRDDGGETDDAPTIPVDDVETDAVPIAVETEVLPTTAGPFGPVVQLPPAPEEVPTRRWGRTSAAIPLTPPPAVDQPITPAKAPTPPKPRKPRRPKAGSRHVQATLAATLLTLAMIAWFSYQSLTIRSIGQALGVVTVTWGISTAVAAARGRRAAGTALVSTVLGAASVAALVVVSQLPMNVTSAPVDMSCSPTTEAGSRTCGWAMNTHRTRIDDDTAAALISSGEPLQITTGFGREDIWVDTELPVILRVNIASGWTHVQLPEWTMNGPSYREQTLDQWDRWPDNRGGTYWQMSTYVYEPRGKDFTFRSPGAIEGESAVIEITMGYGTAFLWTEAVNDPPVDLEFDPDTGLYFEPNNESYFEGDE